LTSGECFVDVAMPEGERKKKKNAVYDGGTVFWVDRLVRLSDAGEIYVDALFPRIFDEAGASSRVVLGCISSGITASG